MAIIDPNEIKNKLPQGIDPLLQHDELRPVIVHYDPVEPLTENESITPHKNQLRWACRRGMLELDQFLLTFFDDCYEQLSTAEQETFALLLQENDQDLYNWLLNVSTAPDPLFQTLCDKIRDHAQRTF